jgi:hypothetical protein
MLMPGRSVFDTIGMCVTNTHYTEIPHFNWYNGPAFNFSGGDNTEALGTASLSGTGSGGVAATGTTGGLSYVISGITAHSVTVKTFFSTISGPVRILTGMRLYRGLSAAAPIMRRDGCSGRC